MKTNKILIDVLFILISALILLLLNQYGLLQKYAVFTLIPILVAYFLGQFAERKFKG